MDIIKGKSCKLQTLFKKVLLAILLMMFILGCQDGEIGTKPGTVPGLFTTWQLVSTSVSCPGDDVVVTQPEEDVLLTLRSNTYNITLGGETIYDGTVKFDGELIFFTPSPFPNNFLGQVNWVFNGRNLVLNSSESRGPGSIENCSVRRSYNF